MLETLSEIPTSRQNIKGQQLLFEGMCENVFSTKATTHKKPGGKL